MLEAFPDALLFPYPKSAGSIARDFKWLGSYRYGITHLGGRDEADLQDRCERASALLGWAAPYAAPGGRGRRRNLPGPGRSHPGTPIASGAARRGVPSTAEVNP